MVVAFIMLMLISFSSYDGLYISSLDIIVCTTEKSCMHEEGHRLDTYCAKNQASRFFEYGWCSKSDIFRDKADAFFDCDNSYQRIITKDIGDHEYQELYAILYAETAMENEDLYKWMNKLQELC
jgi:hypothetical protein